MKSPLYFRSNAFFAQILVLFFGIGFSYSQTTWDYESLGLSDGQQITPGTVINSGGTAMTINWYDSGNLSDSNIGYNDDVWGGISANNLEIVMDSPVVNSDRRLTMDAIFSKPVDDLEFSILDIDTARFDFTDTSFQSSDVVEVFVTGDDFPETNVRDLGSSYYTLGPYVQLDSESYANGFEGGISVAGSSSNGNVDFDFSGLSVTRVRIVFITGDDAFGDPLQDSPGNPTTNPTVQAIGVSEFSGTPDLSGGTTDVIVAVNDNFSSTPVLPGGTTLSVLSNDNANGSTANNSNTSTPIVINNGGVTNLSFNADGEAFIPTYISDGTYNVTYQVCLDSNSSVCDQATATIVVESATTQPSTINASTDNFSGTTLPPGGITPSVYSNDDVDGSPATDSNATTPTVVSNGGLSGISFNSSGQAIIPSNAADGTYFITYGICLESNTSVCDTSTLIIAIEDVQSISATNDNFSGSPLAPGTLSPSVYSNDLANGVTSSNSNTTTPVVLNNGGLSGLSFNSSGNAVIPSGASSGTYNVLYQICLENNASLCDTATAVISVLSAELTIDAVTDNYSSTPVQPGQTLPSVFSNDTATNAAASNANVTTPVILSNGGLSGISINSNGIPTVPSTAADGTYFVSYRICLEADTSICDTASIVIAVASSGGNQDTIDAVNDNFSGSPVNPGSSTPSILNNDDANGSQAAFNNVTTTILNNGGLTGVSVNQFGFISVPSSATAGTYTLTYRICLASDSSVCDTATVTLTVPQLATIDAVNDDYSGSPVNPGSSTPSILNNDDANGSQAAFNNVTTTLLNDGGLTGVSLNQFGFLSVPSSASGGTYTLTYQICLASDSSVCDTATVTLTVPQLSTIDAVNDDFTSSSVNPGSSTPSILNNDDANGAQAAFNNVTTSMLNNGGLSGVSVNQFGFISVPSDAAAGTYTLTYEICLMSDSSVCDTATVQLTVVDPNVAPTVDAGANQSVTLNQGSATVNLSGTASDDGLPSSNLNTTWSLVNGPAFISFGDDSALSTTVTFTQEGTYTLQLLADDGAETATDTLTVTVDAEPLAPVVTFNQPSGSNVSVEEGYQLYVDANATDSDGSIDFVQLFIDGNLVRQESLAPYEWGVPGSGDENEISGLTEGTYTITVVATDNDGLTGENSFTLTVTKPNEAPVVDAGGNQSVTLIAGSAAVNLSGTVTDDNHPESPLTTTWSALSGPAGVVFGDENALSTTATFTTAGQYTIQLAGDDTEFSNTSTLNVTVEALTIDAVADSGFGTVLPGETLASVFLNDLSNGELSDELNTTTPVVINDGGLTGVSINADGTVNVPADAADGAYVVTYEICLEADGTICDQAEISFTVTAPNTAPVAEAGNNQTVTLIAGTAEVSLSGDVTDDAHSTSPLTTTWSVLSGPGSVSFGDESALNTTATFSVAGEYILQLAADDTEFSDSDTLTVTVEALTIGAVSDSGTLAPGETFPSVYVNDLSNGSTSDDTNTTTPTVISDGGISGASFNADGSLLIPAGTPDGSYTVSYEICLLADGTVCDQADISILVETPNTPPLVEAGENQSATLIGGSAEVVLSATGSDDGLPSNALTFTWSVLNGPASVTFGDENALNTNATFTEAGEYTLQLLADDTELSVTDTLTITVDALTIDAIADTVTGEPGETLASVYANDVSNGAASDDINTTSPVVINDGGLTGVSFNSDGTVNIPLNAVEGTYSLTYEVCLEADNTICDQADVTVNVDILTIDAVSDDSYPNVEAGGTLASVYLNDTSNDEASNDSNTTTPAVINNGGLIGVGFNSDGSISIPFDAANGTYTVTYEICLESDNSVCDQADATITVETILDPVAMEAGDSRTIGLSGSAYLNGSILDGSPVSTTWSQLSGPGTALFGDTTATVTTVSFDQAGLYTLALTGNNGATDFSDTMTVEVFESSDVVIAINSGNINTGHNGANGFTYVPDVHYIGGNEDDNKGGTPVANTQDDILYNYSRWQHTGYEIPVPDGNYLVLLQLAEPYFETANSRIFDTSVEGALVLDDLDLVADHGFWVAYDMAVETTVTDGFLTIEQSASANNTLINGIVILDRGPLNQAPLVEAGEPQTIYLVGGSAVTNLSGTVTDDALPNGVVDTTWSTIAGPASVSIGDISALDTTATFTTAGSYTIELVGDDSELDSSDTVTINVFASTINAVDDTSFLAVQPGGILGSVYDNDTSNGIASDDSNTTTPIVINDGGLTGVSFNTDGSINVPGDAMEGTYTVTYEVCLETDGAVCDQAEVTILIDVLTIDAVADQSFPAVAPGGLLPSVLVNDSANGVASDLSNTTAPVIVTDGGLTGVSINADGTVNIPADAAVGDYIVRYEICLSVENAVCDQANIHITVEIPSNLPPVVEAGNSQSVTLDSGSVVANLTGSASDDGEPNGTLETTWSVVNAPASVGFGDTSALSTTVSFTQSGMYELQLSASDGVETTSDIVTITVEADPLAPVVFFNEPTTQVFTLEEGYSDIYVNVNATDPDGIDFVRLYIDGSFIRQENFFEYEWWPNDLGGLSAGEYTITAIATDETGRSAENSFTLRVVGPNTAPIAEAGINQSATLDNGSALVNLDGVVSDDAHPSNPLTTTWSLVSGPSVVSFGDQNTAQTTATFTEAGEYTLQLTADDTEFSDSDTVTITVVNSLNITVLGDDFTSTPAEPNGVLPSVLLNDSANGESANDANMTTPIVISDGGLTGVSFNADGSINIPDVSTGGTFVVTYEVCLEEDNTVCGQADVSLVIDVDEIPTTPENVMVVDLTPMSITLAWAPSTDDGSVTAYEVYRNDLLINTVTDTTFSDSALDAETTYSYTIVALDDTTNSSLPSEPFIFTTPSASPPVFFASEDIIGCWSFEEDEGIIALDSTPNAFHGTVNGAQYDLNGQVGSAMLFDGLDDRIDIGDAFDVVDLNEMTISLWVNPTTTSLTESNTLISKWDESNADNQSVSLDINTSGYLEFLLDGQVVAVSTSLIPNNAWSFITVTYSPLTQTVTLSLNGQEEAYATGLDISMTTNSASWTIGGREDQTQSFHGLIDEVKIYDRALNSCEIEQNLYRSAYDQWAVAHFKESNFVGAGSELDPDGDGLNNLQEYAFGGDPLVADCAQVSPKLYMQEVLGDLGGTVLAYGLSYKSDDPNLSILVEYSDDLGSSDDLGNLTPWDAVLYEDTLIEGGETYNLAYTTLPLNSAKGFLRYTISFSCNNNL